MRILVPSTRTPTWDGGEPVFIDPADDKAYWRWWGETWARAEGVIVIEHDITPTTRAIDDLANCPGDWCAQPYPYVRGVVHRGLGCVKFSSALMAKTPRLWETVGAMSDGAHPPRHWCRLDAWSKSVLEQDGYRRCDHQVPVTHPVRDGSSHGCC